MKIYFTRKEGTVIFEIRREIIVEQSACWRIIRRCRSLLNYFLSVIKQTWCPYWPWVIPTILLTSDIKIFKNSGQYVFSCLTPWRRLSNFNFFSRILMQWSILLLWVFIMGNYCPGHCLYFVNIQLTLKIDASHSK